MIIDRMYVVQEIIKKTRAKVYLEIGVREGECFLRIRAPKKIAVDPQMLISPKKKRKYYFKNLSNIFNQYFEMTSDDFFKNNHKSLNSQGLDVVFIDGLHTFGQSLRDVQNALKYLKDDGVIIMHDCNPLSEAAAYPAQSYQDAEILNIPGFTGEWNGDTWKTIVYLRSGRKDLDVFVLDCDQGLGIIMKRKPESVLSYSPEAINHLSYKDLDSDRKNLLNLKSQEYFHEFLQTS
jgi:hypothetical protein